MDKSGKFRKVDMSLQLTETLKNIKKQRENTIKKSNTLGWIFVNKVGKPISGDNWRKRVFTKALKKAKIRSIRIHDIRHTFASLLLQAGESMLYVRDQLGHSSIRITVDTYGHLVPGGNKEAVDWMIIYNLKVLFNYEIIQFIFAPIKNI